MQTLAIVGASLAGLSAARAARAQGFAGRLVIIGDETHRPYDRPPLSKDFLLGNITAEDLFLECEDDELNAEWLLGSPAASLEPAAEDGAPHTVTLRNGTVVEADGVVIATGARARTLPGLAGLGNVFSLRTLSDAQGLAPELVAGSRLVVVGAGFIGAEAASVAVTRGMEVTMIDSGPTPFAGPLGAEMGAVIGQLHTDHGVEVIAGTSIEDFYTSEGNVTGMRLSDGRCIGAEVVIVGIGAQPNIEWLAGSGLLIDRGVLCDAEGRTNVPGIVSVGDCASWFEEHCGTHRRVEHWTCAMERPATAVASLLGGVTSPLRPAYFWSDQHGVKLQFAGNAAGFDRLEIAAGDTASRSFVALYYRGEELLAVLGMSQPKLFTKWRRALASPSAPAFVPAVVPAPVQAPAAANLVSVPAPSAASHVSVSLTSKEDQVVC